MKHLSDGTLRRMIDEPFAVGAEVRAHVDQCPRCQAAMRVAREDHSLVALALASPPSGADLSAGRAQVAKREGSARPRASRKLSIAWPRLAPTAASAIVAAALAVSVVTGAAGSFLGVFHPTRPEPILATRAELASLPELRHFGTISVPGNVNSTSYVNLSAVDAATGLHVAVPSSLPSGIPANHTYHVMPAETSSFRFSAAKTAAFASRSHRAIPALPATLDGTRLTLSTNTGVLSIYGGKAEIPDLAIAQMQSPTLTVAGASLSEIENYLLIVPGMPKQLVKQIQSLSSPTNTLPIPVPVNWAYAQNVTVQGRPGLLVGDDTGVGSVVIWVKDGVVYGVGGSLTQSQVLQIANSLR